MVFASLSIFLKAEVNIVTMFAQTCIIIDNGATELP